MSEEFKYRVVFFTQSGCPACDAMSPRTPQGVAVVDENVEGKGVIY
jgi:hypothetical protein